jgi:F-type H+-transporting ATPase subunit alpha
MREEHADILDAIRTQKEITDDTGRKLKTAVDGYAKAFAP